MQQQLMWQDMFNGQLPTVNRNGSQCKTVLLSAAAAKLSDMTKSSPVQLQSSRNSLGAQEADDSEPNDCSDISSEEYSPENEFSESENVTEPEIL